MDEEQLENLTLAVQTALSTECYKTGQRAGSGQYQDTRRPHAATESRRRKSSKRDLKTLSGLLRSEIPQAG